MDTVLNEGDQLAAFRQVWADRNPMRRMGNPQELTGPVVFLCSDIGSSYVNGADLVVDGECRSAAEAEPTSPRRNLTSSTNLILTTRRGVSLLDAFDYLCEACHMSSTFFIGQPFATCGMAVFWQGEHSNRFGLLIHSSPVTSQLQLSPYEMYE